MIRSLWAYTYAAFVTVVFGTVVFVASLLRHRGGIYFWVARNWSRSLLWGSASGVRAHGLERVDWSKPHVLVSNHISSFDILAIAVSVPVPYHFVAKKELERVPIFGPAWVRAGHISIDRHNRQNAIASLQKAAEVIRRDGGIVVIFPEGTRSPTTELQLFKKGAFQLAVAAGVPILPVVVRGSDAIAPPGTWRISPGMMDLHIGDPVPVDDYVEGGRLDDLIAEVRGRMQAMLEEVGAAGRGTGAS